MDAHDTHCCIEHGCKYGHEDCPIANGVRRQKFLCESCAFESEMVVNNKKAIDKYLDFLWDTKSDTVNKKLPTKEQFFLLDTIMQYVIKYDEQNGSYPEHCYEGLSFYEFVYSELIGEFPDVKEIRKQNKNVYKNI